jgi:hypothetical protein
MTNGLSNRDSEQGSGDRLKPPTAALPDDAVDNAWDDVAAKSSADKFSDAPAQLASDTAVPAEVEGQADIANVVHTESPLRRIEAHWKGKRSNNLLREVYDDEE